MGEIKFGKLMIYISMVIIAALVVGGFFYYYSYYNQQTKNAENNREQIKIDERINKKDNLIKVAEPKPNQIVSSPLAVAGEARGNWYFEASFPVALFDGLDTKYFYLLTYLFSSLG